MTKVMVHSGNVGGALRKLNVERDGSGANLKEGT